MKRRKSLEHRTWARELHRIQERGGKETGTEVIPASHSGSPDYIPALSSPCITALRPYPSRSPASLPISLMQNHAYASGSQPFQPKTLASQSQNPTPKRHRKRPDSPIPSFRQASIFYLSFSYLVPAGTTVAYPLVRNSISLE